MLNFPLKSFELYKASKVKENILYGIPPEIFLHLIDADYNCATLQDKYNGPLAALIEIISLTPCEDLLLSSDGVIAENLKSLITNLKGYSNNISSYLITSDNGLETSVLYDVTMLKNILRNQVNINSIFEYYCKDNPKLQAQLSGLLDDLKNYVAEQFRKREANPEFEIRSGEQRDQYLRKKLGRGS